MTTIGKMLLVAAVAAALLIPAGEAFARRTRRGGSCPNCQQQSTTVTLAEQPRQYHTAWQWNASKNQFECDYVFKASPDGQYATHKCVQFPDKPGVCFYYNPAKDKFWGAYWINEAQGKNFVADKSMEKPTPDQLVAKKGEAGGLPSIPGATDMAALVPPRGLAR